MSYCGTNVSFGQVNTRDIEGLEFVNGAAWPPNIIPVPIPANDIVLGTAGFNPAIKDSGVQINTTGTGKIMDFNKLAPNTLAIVADPATGQMALVNNSGVPNVFGTDALGPTIMANGLTGTVGQLLTADGLTRCSWQNPKTYYSQVVGVAQAIAPVSSIPLIGGLVNNNDPFASWSGTIYTNALAGAIEVNVTVTNTGPSVDFGIQIIANAVLVADTLSPTPIPQAGTVSFSFIVSYLAATNLTVNINNQDVGSACNINACTITFKRVE
mgnify:CR=1 FL=1